jgi:hypothetical protein
MVNNYCQDLTLDFILDTSVLNRVQSIHKDADNGAIFKIHQSEVDPNLLHFLNELDLTVNFAEIFYTPPNKNLFIHIDNNYISNNCKLNWVYGGSGSVMEWWERKNPKAPLEFKLTDIGSKYIYFNRDECVKVWQHEVKQPSLVNVGIPHSVQNNTNAARWCVSHSIYDLDRNKQLEWQDAIKIFDKFLTTIQ